MAGPIAGGTHGKHHRNLHQHPHHRGQRGAGPGAKQGNRGGHSKFEEVAGADQRARRRQSGLVLETAVEVSTAASGLWCNHLSHINSKNLADSAVHYLEELVHFLALF